MKKPHLRGFAIMDFLKKRKQKYCSIQELTDHFGVSIATMYRDIADLEAREMIQKVYGGIALRDLAAPKAPVASSPFEERINRNREQKAAIAARALAAVAENDILFLDSSTTVYCLAQRLQASTFANLAIITNSVLIIQDFHKFPAHYVRVGLGGSYDAQLNAFLGQATLRELGGRDISKAFVSAFGFGDGRATTNHENHGALLQQVLARAAHKYLLIDSSKTARSGLFPIATKDDFDAVFTD